jgi:hypothetical protein
MVFILHFSFFIRPRSGRSERDSSGTTRITAKRWAGDGADSPTQAAEGGEAARPNQNIIFKYIK